MNYPAASSEFIEYSDEDVRSELLLRTSAISNFTKSPFRSGFCSPVGDLAQVNGPRALPAPTRISPAPTTE